MENAVVKEPEYSFKSLLTEVEYLKLLLAQLISRFGDSIDTIAYGWMVYKLTGSSVLITTLYAVNAIPNLIFGMISGVASNYFKKKNIVLMCDFGRGLVVLLTATLYITGHLQVWHLYIFTFFNSTFESFRQPAAIVLYSYTVPKEKVAYAKSLDGTLSKTVELVGFGVAGILIALLGVGGVIVIDAITFILCGLIIGTVVIHNEFVKKEALTVKGYFVDLKEGFRYMIQNKLILQIALFATVFNLFVVPINSLQAIYIGDVLHGGAYVMSLFNVSILVGVLLGGILVPMLKNRVSGKAMFIASGVFIALSYLGLSVIHLIDGDVIKFALLSVLTFIMGASIPLINMQVGIAMMTKVDKEFLSRVGANLNTFGMCATPLGALLAGAAISFISISQLFGICSILLLVLSLSQIRNKTLKSL